MKRAEMCWLIDLAYGFNTYLSPDEAFFLACCNGLFTKEEIIEQYAQIGGGEDPERLFEKYSELLTLKDAESVNPNPYNPAHFLYLPRPGALPGRMESPVEAMLSITHACNYRCVYCFNASEKKYADELTTREWLDVVEQLAKMEVGVVTLTGGEPMLHEGFYTIVAAILEKNMQPFICTNASLIDPAYAKRLARIGVKLVQVSIDASEEQFDLLTGVRGSYVKTHNAIESLVEAGIYVCAKGVATTLNIDGFPDLCEALEKLGVGYFMIDRYDTGPIGRSGADMMVTDSAMLQLRHTLRAGKRKMKVSIAEARKHWINEKDIVPCGAFRRSILILPNGEMNGCEKLAGFDDMRVGNVRESSLKDLWRSEKIMEILEPTWQKISIKCAGCEHLEQCGTGCFAIKRFLNQDMYDMDPRCWQASGQDNPYALL